MVPKIIALIMPFIFIGSEKNSKLKSKESFCLSLDRLRHLAASRKTPA